MLNDAIVSGINLVTDILSKPFGIIGLVLIISFIVWRCYMEPDFIAWVFVGVIVFPLLYLLFFSWTDTENKKEEWNKWASEHCKIIEKRDGSTSLESGFGITTSGKAATGVFTNSTPDQTAYKCDDGVIYWKNN
ncbi:hypothetical protein VJT93_004434 [Salmonella enterica]|uniref:hypothetical protein n=1 Tax=Enterobacteriaceae TaxID=543 RepID=UPI000FAD55B1|nr:hypothetical protein [Escherichia coli]EAR9740267.1 hypothetical protein [Salmonella enterica]EBG0049897.1 hypothetical protein [Salmonella enterica subsp. enterica serovar Stanley]EBW5488157.1 hypothetical protein [Salmonella enterica subsp. enterica serovar Kiambu]EBX3015936.1 hypothetical protein [Salmonella enterica subsp. enterica serovar Typhimurium]ECG2674785.1 hypothetical protein [Salmonella enterica subsp. enterica serovar Chester]ECR6316038.1 hypothetical protein [Salmonella ent